MGAAAYQRGSKVIRQQIEDEQKQPVKVSRAYLNQLERAAKENDDLKAKITRLETELKRAKLAYHGRVAHVHVLQDDLRAERERTQAAQHESRTYRQRWDKCSAILNIVKAYDRESLVQSHLEAQRDHPELWPDLERDAYGWPVRYPSTSEHAGELIPRKD